MVSVKNPHVGGEQMPLLKPESDWRPPASLPDLRRHKKIALDRETRDDGLSAGRGPGWAKGAGCVCGVAVAWPGGSAYLPIAHPDTECVDADAVRRWELDHQKAGVEFVYHNVHYDVGWGLTGLGVPCPPVVHDTGAAAVMLDENRLSYELNALCAWRGIPGKDETLLREAAAAYCIDPKKELWKLPARYVGGYAEQDAAATLALHEALAPDMVRDGVDGAYELEMQLVPTVHEMMRRGVRVDTEQAERTRDGLLGLRDQALRVLGEKLVQTVTIEDTRSARMLERWHDAAKIAYPRTAKTGVGSFTKEWMRGHAHWLPSQIDRIGQLDEAANKFIQGFILDHAHRGRIHASINQFRGEEGGTRSHRFSYSDPPLQQMPSRDEDIAPLVRNCFLPEQGEWWLAADYSQQEYRLIVHYAALLKCSKAEEAAELYRRDPKTDFHALVVEWTGLERRSAKDTNFAKAFGAGVKKFASMIRKSEQEAARIMDLYDKKLPFVRELAQRCSKAAEQRGYIRLIDGARCHFDLWEPGYRRDLSPESMGVPYMTREKSLLWAENYGATHDCPPPRMKRAFTHKAMNREIQGSAARQTKMAMSAIAKEGWTPLLQMHDELGFSVSSEAQVQRVAEIMRDVVRLEVPVLVDAELGPTWGRAKHDWKGRRGMKTKRRK